MNSDGCDAFDGGLMGPPPQDYLDGETRLAVAKYLLAPVR
jgi:hypothetical protein